MHRSGSGKYLHKGQPVTSQRSWPEVEPVDVRSGCEPACDSVGKLAQRVAHRGDLRCRISRAHRDPDLLGSNPIAAPLAVGHPLSRKDDGAGWIEFESVDVDFDRDIGGWQRERARSRISLASGQALGK